MSTQPKSLPPTRNENSPSADTGSSLLEELSAYLASDLEQVDRVLAIALDSKIGLTKEVCQYLRAASGKRLRPMLTLLASRIGGQPTEPSFRAAAMVELIHVASLLHDDVIDRAALRRGQPTVNMRWGNEVAILMADYLYSRALAIAALWLPADLLAILADVTASMCDGEIFQIQKSGELLDEDDYHYIIRCKTARFFSACMHFGAQLNDAPADVASALERYGLEFGLAFQITDDILDMMGDPRRMGKDVGTDIASGKQSLPFIYALSKADERDRDFLIAALNDGKPSHLVVECIGKYGGIEYARSVARKHAQSANQAVATLPDCEPLRFMRALTDLVVNRTY